MESEEVLVLICGVRLQDFQNPGWTSNQAHMGRDKGVVQNRLVSSSRSGDQGTEGLKTRQRASLQSSYPTKRADA